MLLESYIKIPQFAPTMGMGRISTGSDVLDEFLDGGYETDVVTTIYGPAGSGKTTLCLLTLIKVIASGRKVVFIDTEGGFSITRLQQLFPDFKSYVDNILFLKPTTFEEQKKAFERLKEVVDGEIGLVIIDSASMLYRLELGRRDEITQTNRELGAQVAILCEIARKKNIPTLLTNQVYSSFDDRDRINIVGGDILRYSSKCLIELASLHGNIRVATLRKHRSIPNDRSVRFRIGNEGLMPADAQAVHQGEPLVGQKEDEDTRQDRQDVDSYFQRAADVMHTRK